MEPFRGHPASGSAQVRRMGLTITGIFHVCPTPSQPQPGLWAMPAVPGVAASVGRPVMLGRCHPQA